MQDYELNHQKSVRNNVVGLLKSIWKFSRGDDTILSPWYWNEQCHHELVSGPPIWGNTFPSILLFFLFSPWIYFWVSNSMVLF